MLVSNDNELKNVTGGGTISGTVANAFVKIIELLYEAGKGVGSSIRRIGEGKLCPLD